MQFLVDPGHLSLTPIAWVFLAFVGWVLPFAALLQHRRMAAAGTVLPSRISLYASALFMHGVLVLFAWAVSRDLDINLVAPFRPTTLRIVVGLVALAIGLVGLLPQLDIDNPVGEARAKLLVPHTKAEHCAFYVICVSAGIAEELAYRGLLFTLLSAVLGGWWIPALVASAAFGIVHLFQGWKSAGIAGVMGLGEHIVVGLTGSLFVAILVHMLHDAIGGTVIAARVRRAEEADAIS
jgi:membrane protease YdiL (CAAX protease family)